MEINQRQRGILEAVVKDYIRFGLPISSRWVEKKYRFGVCPATIRGEMQKLTSRKYLYQSYASSGRIPTDKGYRFFVNQLLEKNLAPETDGLAFSFLFQRSPQRADQKDVFPLASQIARTLASCCSGLTVIGFLQESFFLREGWEETLQEPEFSQKDFLFSFTRFLKEFEQNIKELSRDPGIRVYIGQETPLKGARDFSIIISQCLFPEGKKAIVSIVGPKRMAYDQNLRAIRSFIESLESL